jgi:hypothetical protein
VLPAHPSVVTEKSPALVPESVHEGVGKVSGVLSALVTVRVTGVLAELKACGEKT